MTKKMSAIFVAVMLLAQIGIAQHNALHFTDHGHYGHGHYEHGHDKHEHNDSNHDQKENLSEACQTCLLTKSLSFGLVSDHADISAAMFSQKESFRGPDQIATNHKRAFYNPRAPPFFFI